MARWILLLKKDDDGEPQDTDLHPPSGDLLARFPTTGSHDMVVLAVVPTGYQFGQRKRLPLDDDFYLIEDVLQVLEPMESGVMRW